MRAAWVKMNQIFKLQGSNSNSNVFFGYTIPVRVQPPIALPSP